MTKTKVWKFLSQRFSPESSSGRAPAKCPVAAEHRGPLIAVAGNGNATVMMCTHHAMAWTDSDLCRDEAWRGSLPLGPPQSPVELAPREPWAPSEPHVQSPTALWCH